MTSSGKLGGQSRQTTLQVIADLTLQRREFGAQITSMAPAVGSTASHTISALLTINAGDAAANFDES